MLPRRIVFMGTPDFACPSFRALAGGGATPVLAVTQPDRPAGRGHGLKVPPVKALASELGVEVFQPATLKDPGAQERIRAVEPDAIVVAAFGQILPRAVLGIPPLGCINVHASLLPRHRGASPIARAIWEGDAETGVCIMAMEAGLDTGPVFLRRSVPVPPDATACSLEETLAILGAELLTEALEGIVAGKLLPVPQGEEGVTVAPRIKRAEGLLDFRQGAVRLERQVRALHPWPGAFLRHGEEEIKVLRGAVGGTCGDRTPGQVVPGPGLAVACGDGLSLHLLELQRPGKRPVAASDFLRGFPISPGTTFLAGGER